MISFGAFDKQVTLSRSKMVCDESIGELSFVNKWEFNLRKNYFEVFEPAESIDGNCVCIILESPHTKEFEDVKLRHVSTDKEITSRPLNHPSTRNSLIRFLNEQCSELFSTKLNKSQSYKVVLVNSIQYQCSLGLSTNQFRDRIFLYNWITLKDDLIKRVQRIAPVYYINCCTKGNETTEKGSFFNEHKLNSFGLRFTETNSLFEVRSSFNKPDFNLRDLVERQLELAGIISNDNYKKYDHPSSFNHKDLRNFRKSDGMNFCKKILHIDLLNKIT